MEQRNVWMLDRDRHLDKQRQLLPDVIRAEKKSISLNSWGQCQCNAVTGAWQWTF